MWVILNSTGSCRCYQTLVVFCNSDRQNFKFASLCSAALYDLIYKWLLMYSLGAALDLATGYRAHIATFWGICYEWHFLRCLSYQVELLAAPHGGGGAARSGGDFLAHITTMVVAWIDQIWQCTVGSDCYKPSQFHLTHRVFIYHLLSSVELTRASFQNRAHWDSSTLFWIRPPKTPRVFEPIYTVSR
jgi:hypothetical protein